MSSWCCGETQHLAANYPPRRDAMITATANINTVNEEMWNDLIYIQTRPASDLSIAAGVGPNAIKSLALRLAGEMARLQDNPDEQMKIINQINTVGRGEVFHDLWKLFLALDPDYVVEAPKAAAAIKPIATAPATVTAEVNVKGFFLDVMGMQQSHTKELAELKEEVKRNDDKISKLVSVIENLRKELKKVEKNTRTLATV